MSETPKKSGCTVAELIEHLKTFDPRCPVVFSQHSNEVDLELDMVTAAEMFNNGGYWTPAYRKRDHPLLRTVVSFPGN